MQIAGGHTNVICLRKNDRVLLQREYVQGGQVEQTDHTQLNVENTITHVGRLASIGMRQTDEEIIHIMVGL